MKERSNPMSTQFEFTVPPDGTIPIVLPEEFRGGNARISVEKIQPEKEENIQTVLDSVTLDQLAKTHQTGILSLIGILKDDDGKNDGTDERYNDLMEKYYRARNID